MTIADRLLEARGRDGVAGVRDTVAASVADAAAMFGLDYTDDTFVLWPHVNVGVAVAMPGLSTHGLGFGISVGTLISWNT